MKKVIPILLAGALTLGGCALYPDDYYYPYGSTRVDFGYSYGWPSYYWPSAYTYGCNGYYGPNGRCYYNNPVYIPVPVVGPDDEPIPATQPRVMATEQPWAFTRPTTQPWMQRREAPGEPGVAGAWGMTPMAPRSSYRPEGRTRSRPAPVSRPAPASRPASSPPPPRSTPRAATPSRSTPNSRPPARVQKER